MQNILKKFNIPAYPLIIAEIGTSHKGNLDRAFEMINAAKKSGAHCVKFQMVFADEIIHPLSGEIDLPGGKTPLYEVFKKLEREPSFYHELKKYSEELGLLFLCTPFGIKSARFLRDMDVKAMKIASPELNHIPLIEEMAGYDIPTFLSTGVSTLADIEEAVTLLNQDVMLLHCITSYPAPEEEYNLNVLINLRNIFGLPVGISDHSLNPRLVPALSTVLGACAIEKHFTLSREENGLDDPIALTPALFAQMTEAVCQAKSAGYEKTIKALSSEYGENLVKKILGTGIKRLAPCEIDNYHTTNRSILAVKELCAGDRFTFDNIAVLRSEKNLSHGLHPRFYSLLLDKAARCPIKDGEGIQWYHFL